MMDCNIEYAEILSMLKAYYDQNGYPVIIDGGRKRRATAKDLSRLHDALGKCFFHLFEMDTYEM